MRFRLALAFSVSIMLIGLASWSRFSMAEKPVAGLVAINQAGTTLEDSSEMLQDFLGPKASSTSSVSEEPLTGTDLVGRQLILDYVSLAASGGVSQTNLAALANKYVENIPALIKSEVISSSDLRTSSNNKEDIRNYSAKLWVVVLNHEQRINSVYEDDWKYSAESSYNVIGQTSSIYAETASKLRDMEVPLILSSVHADLVNIELMNSAAAKAVAEMATDPVTGFAGLVIFNQNMDKEMSALATIRKVLGLDNK